jgi:3'(2'), 5'-bisphosphate nucleotidase
MNLSALAEKIIPIAIAAGEKIMDVYQNNDFLVTKKEDNSPVTAADKISNQHITNALHILTPHIPIISEENDIPPFEIRKTYEYYWLIDPLDGTKEFINRNGEFAVHIALVHQQRAVLGVVHIPAQQKTYVGAAKEGAFCLENGAKKILKADSFKMSQSGLAIAVTRSHFNQATADFIGQFNFPRLIAMGSSLKMMLLAAGKAHLHPRYGTTMEWDTAAPQIILEEAGGKVLKINGNPLDYNQKADLKNPDFIAYGKLED